MKVASYLHSGFGMLLVRAGAVAGLTGTLSGTLSGTLTFLFPTSNSFFFQADRPRASQGVLS